MKRALYKKLLHMQTSYFDQHNSGFIIQRFNSDCDMACTGLLENLKKMVHSENAKKVLLPVITALRDIAELALTEADAAKLRQGQAISPRSYQDQNLKEGVAVASFDGELGAVVRIEEKRISPQRVFNFNSDAEISVS